MRVYACAFFEWFEYPEGLHALERSTVQCSPNYLLHAFGGGHFFCCECAKGLPWVMLHEHFTNSFAHLRIQLTLHPFFINSVYHTHLLPNFSLLVCVWAHRGEQGLCLRIPKREPRPRNLVRDPHWHISVFGPEITLPARPDERKLTQLLW